MSSQYNTTMYYYFFDINTYQITKLYNVLETVPTCISFNKMTNDMFINYEDKHQIKDICGK